MKQENSFDNLESNLNIKKPETDYGQIAVNTLRRLKDDEDDAVYNQGDPIKVNRFTVFIKKHHLKVMIMLLALCLVLIFKITSSAQNKTSRFFTQTDLSNADQITCKYPQLLHANTDPENMINHELPKPETNPLVFTFSDLDNKNLSQLSYIDSTQTITTIPVLKLMENDEKIIFADGTGENYFSTHTIFKKSGVSVYSKSVDIFGYTSGSLGIGNCVGY